MCFQVHAFQRVHDYFGSKTIPIAVLHNLVYTYSCTCMCLVSVCDHVIKLLAIINFE